MNPSQSSIYRDLELLMQWYLPIGVKMPKVDALLNLGNFFQKNLLEATTACAIALDTYDMGARLEFINTMIWHLALCNTSVSQLYHFSSMKMEDGRTLRVVSQVQYTNYLEQLKALKEQIGRWKKKTAAATA